MIVKVLVFMSAAVILGFAREMYDSKFDAIDIDEILKSDRLIGNYVDCFMDRKRCTPQAGEIKDHLPELLQTECAKCTPKQKEKGKKTLNFLFDEKPDLYKELEDKYDPQKHYRQLKGEEKI